MPSRYQHATKWTVRLSSGALVRFASREDATAFAVEAGAVGFYAPTYA